MKTFLFEEAAAYLGITPEVLKKFIQNEPAFLAHCATTEVFDQKSLDLVLSLGMITDDGILLSKRIDDDVDYFMSDNCQKALGEFFDKYCKITESDWPAHVVGYTHVRGKRIPKIMGYAVYDGCKDRYEKTGFDYDEDILLAFVCPFCGNVHYHLYSVIDGPEYHVSRCGEIDGYILRHTKDLKEAGFCERKNELISMTF